MLRFIFFVLVLFQTNSSFAGKLSFAHKSIVDDEVAAAIKPPRPTSVSEILSMVSKENLDEVEVFDLSDNIIGSKGAIQILKFVVTSIDAGKFPKLSKLDLGWNRISGSDDEDLKEAFKEVIKLPQIQEVNIEGNYCAYIGWIQTIVGLSEEASRKLSWCQRL